MLVALLALARALVVVFFAGAGIVLVGNRTFGLTARASTKDGARE